MNMRKLCSLLLALVLLASAAGCAATENGSGETEQEQQGDTSGSTLPDTDRSGNPIARNRIALELQQGAGGLQSRVDMTSSRSLNHVRARPGAAIPGWADAS